MSGIGAVPSNVAVATSVNWISSQGLYSLAMPQNDRNLIHAFGSQDITGFIEQVNGGKGQIGGLQWRHWEEERLDTIVNATGTATGVGTSVIYTLTSTYEMTGFPADFNPYNVASYGFNPATEGTTTLNPVRVNQNVTIGAPQYKGTVTAVTATTFTVAPDGAVALPTTVGTEPILLGSLVFGEGEDQPTSLNFRLNEFTGVAQIEKETALVTGSALGIETWVKMPNDDGTMGYVYYFKNQLDARKRLKNQREIDFVSGQAVTSTGDVATFDPTLLKTSGLITFAQSYAGVNDYNISPGISLDDFYDLVIDQIDRNKGDNENSIWCAINLRRSIDSFVRPEMQAGAISYGTDFGGDTLDAAARKQKYIDFDFSGIGLLGKTFQLKTYDPFNNPTLLGAIPGYQNLGIVVPMGRSTERLGDLKEKIDVPSLRINYVVNGSYNREWEEWLFGGADGIYNTTTDTKQVNFRTHFSFEGFRPNAYALLQGE